MDDPKEPLKTPAQIHFEIALEYQRSGQLDEAIARYRQAIAHDEGYSLAYYNLGLAYWAEGRIPLAVSSFKAARSGRDTSVQVQAHLRLRELATAEQNSQHPGAAPTPLEPEMLVREAAEGPRPMDPAVTRQVWLSLIAGVIVSLVLAVMAWLYVTLVALGGLGGSGLM